MAEQLSEKEKSALLEVASWNQDVGIEVLKDVHVSLMVRGLACLSDRFYEVTYEGQEVARFFMN